MIDLRRAIEKAREVDKKWQRKRRPSRRQILVNARTAMNYATVAPIVQRLQSDRRIELYFTASEKPHEMGPIFADANPPFRLIKPTSVGLLRFDIYLASDFLWMTLPRGARRVQTFHGVAGKYRTVYDSPGRSMRDWDRLFFINQHRLNHFVRSGAIDEDSDAARLIGMPKLDCLVDGTLKRDEVLLSLNLDPSRKTVLYAPTWSPHSSVVQMGEELVRRLGEAGYTVIVKLHDRSRDLTYVNSGGVDWGARLEPVLNRFGGLLATGSNSSIYLPAADVLITDHSSVGFEYLLLDRPLVRIEIPELIKNTDIEPSYVELLADASTSVKDVDETLRAVETGFADPQIKSSNRNAVANEMFYKPGTATSRAVSELYELMELDTAAS